MNKSVKLFIASMVVFACALGFFAGALCFNQRGTCPKGMMMAPPPPPPMEGYGKHHTKSVDAPRVAPEVLDSILQVTPEQKEAIRKHRAETDSMVKEIRGQRKAAEKQLREALDSGDREQIAVAKAAVQAAQSAMLDQRIQGYLSLSETLSKEQMEKFREFHRIQQKNRSHGPRHGKPGMKPPHEGPKGQMPPPQN